MNETELNSLRQAIDADRDRLMTALGHEKHSDRYWCPFCQKGGNHKTPDFSVEAGFVCHKCGWKGDGFKLVEELRACDFKGAIAFVAGVYGVNSNGASQPTTPKAKTKGKLHADANAAARAACWSVGQHTGKEHREVARWPYHNQAGEIIAYVIRCEPVDAKPDEQGKIEKTFIPIHRDGDGWRVGDPRVKWPLYRLTEIEKAQGPVFVVEGEKAADAGRKIGLCCTTSAHGAKSPNKTDWKILAGRDVIILPDNDPAGQDYAQKVAMILNKMEAPA